MTNLIIRKILYTKPSITELEVQYATDAAANGWGEHCYDYIVPFEEAFKAHLRVKNAIATSSCTDRVQGRYTNFVYILPDSLLLGPGTA